MERISVLVRVRPLDKQEAVKGIPWKITGNTICLSNQGPKFEFDRVFGEDSKTVDIYEARTKDIVAAAVRGFNGTVFAYGQTSSGKTHTMRGSSTEPGVIPLAVHEVFKNIQEAEDREFLLRMSYMEIYNEEINDLLVPEHRKLQVHESVERGIFVAGLSEEIVATPEQVLQLMEFGESHRHIGETNMNVYSSRSHTIFRMVIESRDKNEDESVTSCDAVRVSVLNLVDLAGSERVAKTGAEGARLKEGSHINKSLMTLGTVINKLSEGVEYQGGHVPYRDSKLTRILQPALGGNAKTAIICNITPALIHVDETKGTLQFASRALRVTNCAQVNEVMTDAALLKRQKKEIEELRAKLQGSHSEHLGEEILNLRNTLLQSELERERIALELQEEKKAQAERERRLKEQAQKIENLSTMVLYSAMDDREKRVKKNNRRETWCPHAPLNEFTEEEFNRPSKAPFNEVLPGRRDRDLPPPFQKLFEEHESNTHTSSRESGDAVGKRASSENDDGSNSWVGCTLPDANASVHVTDRKKKFPVESMTLSEVRDELLELQTRFQDLECEHENQRKIKNCEIEDLKKRLAKAEAVASKQQKNSRLHHGQSIDRRGKSLTGWESEAFMMNRQLEEQVKTLELEKLYMQRDLDRLMDLAKGEKEHAKRAFEELHQELIEAQEEATRNKQQLDSVLAQIELMQKEKEEGVDNIMFEFDDLRMEVASLKATTHDVQSMASDSIHLFSIATKLLQGISSAECDIGFENCLTNIEKGLQCCKKDFKEDDTVTDGTAELLISQGFEVVGNDDELKTDQSVENKMRMLDPIFDFVRKDEIVSAAADAKADMILSSGASFEHLKNNSQCTAKESAGEEMLESCITEIESGTHATLGASSQNLKESQCITKESSGMEMLELTADKFESEACVTLTEPFAVQESTLSGQLDSGSVLERKETMGSFSASVISETGVLSDTDIFALLEVETKQAMKLLRDLRNLSQHEELFSEKLLCNSVLDDMFSDLQRVISESNKLVNCLWIQGRGESKYCPDIEVTEVHLAHSPRKSDECSGHQNHNVLKCSEPVHSMLSQFETEATVNGAIFQQELSVKIDGKCDSGSLINQENRISLASDARDVSESEGQMRYGGEEELLDNSRGTCIDREDNTDLITTNGGLNDKFGNTIISSGLDSRLGSTDGQTEMNSTFTVVANGDIDSVRKNTAGLEVDSGLNAELERLNSEVKGFREKVEYLEVELSVAVKERNKYFEAEVVVLKQLESVQAAIQLSEEEKEHLQEVHRQTIIKLQTFENEIERYKCELEEMGKSLEHSNLEKNVVKEKFSQLEMFLHQKIEEQNVLSSEQKHTSEALMKAINELELEKEVRASLSQQIEEQKMLVTNYENACAASRKKIEDIETEKAVMLSQIAAEHVEAEALRLSLENATAALKERDQVQNTERIQLMSEISNLRKEVAKSASSSLVREKELLRKDLEKTKSKLKDTEAKLRNILQEKSKLEAEKANTDREIKLLRGQSTLLQRDISKRESLADKRRESKAFDLSKAKNQLGFTEQSLQLKTMELERTNFDLEILRENYDNVQRSLTEVQDKLAASEADLFIANEEREEAWAKADTVASELEVASDKLKATCSELSSLNEKHAALTEQFCECEAICRQLENTVSVISKEKEEMAMQLTDAFLQLEEEKAVWNAKEKASIEALKEEENKFNMVKEEVSVLTADVQKLKDDLECSKEQCKQLSEQLSVADVEIQEQRRVSMMKALEVDQLREDLCHSEAEHEISQNATKTLIEDLKSRIETHCSENQRVSKEVMALQNQLDKVKCERDEIRKSFEELVLKVEAVGEEKLAALSEQALLKGKYNEMHSDLILASEKVEALMEKSSLLEKQLANEKMNFIKQTTKLQVRIGFARAKLDAFRGRYHEVLDELTITRSRFGEDSRKLKEQLVASRLEVFDLKKKLMAVE